MITRIKSYSNFSITIVKEKEIFKQLLSSLISNQWLELLNFSFMQVEQHIIKPNGSMFVPMEM